jgi:hypothetical protein
MEGNTREIEIVDMYETGLSLAYIGKLLGISRQRVHQIISKFTKLTDENRKLVFAKNGKCCKMCGSESLLNIHHIEYKNVFCIDDYIVLCVPCHRYIHSIYNTNNGDRKELTRLALLGEVTPIKRKTIKTKYYQYSDKKRCAYCGKYENGEMSREGWFGADSDGDKICDTCADGSDEQHTIEGKLYFY